MRVLFLEGTEPFVFLWNCFTPHISRSCAPHGPKRLAQREGPLPGTEGALGYGASDRRVGDASCSQARGMRRARRRYTANTTEQMLSRMAPNTRVNTIMGHTNLNQWDIFMSSICSVAITRPVGAM